MKLLCVREPKNGPLSLLCSSDGEERGNPMVSHFQDELDLDDTKPSLPSSKTLPLTKDVILTSDEEEEKQPLPHTVTLDQGLDSEPENLTTWGFYPLCCSYFGISNL